MEWNTHTNSRSRIHFTKKTNKTNQPSTQILMRHCHEVWKWERARLQSTGSTEQRAIYIDTSGERTMAYNVCQAAEIKSRIKFKHETYNERYFWIHRNRKFSFFPIASSLSVFRCECVLTRPSDSRVLRDSEPTFNANATSNADLWCFSVVMVFFPLSSF